jgi:hypothetical protein
MNSLTLTRPELNRLLKIFAATCITVVSILTAGCVLFFEKSLFAAVLQSASIAITVLTIAFTSIAYKPWVWPKLANWLGRPIVHGLWWGTLYTDYRQNDDKQHEPILIAFVISQSYLSLSIQSFTKRQPAASTLETLYVDDKTKNAQLRYVFEMIRRAYAENKITNGYGELTLQDDGKKLEGHYWTNSPTQGRLELKLISRKCDGLNSFESVERLVNKQ